MSKKSSKLVIWKEVKAKAKGLDVDRIVQSRMFEVPTPLGPGVEPRRKFFLFRWVGDRIEGYLGAPITNIRRNTSYPLRLTCDIIGNEYLKKGDMVEFFGNKLLHTVIKDNELIGSLIQIIYIGQQHIPGCGKMRKIFRVYKLEGISEIEQHPKPNKK